MRLCLVALSNDSENENTPLQLKLNDLTDAITKIGTTAGGILFASLLVRYFCEPGTTNPQRYFDLPLLANLAIDKLFFAKDE